MVKALTNDAARALGRSPNSFYLAEETYTDAVEEVSTNVHVILVGQNAIDRAAVRASPVVHLGCGNAGLACFRLLRPLATASYLPPQVEKAFAATVARGATWALAAERLYALRCRADDGASCDSAAGLLVSAVTVLATLCAALVVPRFVA